MAALPDHMKIGRGAVSGPLVGAEGIVTIYGETTTTNSAAFVSLPVFIAPAEMKINRVTVFGYGGGGAVTLQLCRATTVAVSDATAVMTAAAAGMGLATGSWAVAGDISTDTTTLVAAQRIIPRGTYLYMKGSAENQATATCFYQCAISYTHLDFASSLKTSD